MKTLKQDFLNTAKIILLAVILTAGISYAWTGPSATAPGSNTDAPINVGTNGQSKVGGLILGTGLTSSDNGLIITNGKVGIGNIAPVQALDVTGQIHSSGDICTDAGGGKCLSTVSGGSNSGQIWYVSNGYPGISFTFPYTGKYLVEASGTVGVASEVGGAFWITLNGTEVGNMVSVWHLDRASGGSTGGNYPFYASGVVSGISANSVGNLTVACNGACSSTGLTVALAPAANPMSYKITYLGS